MAEPLQGKFALLNLNQAPPTRRVWLRASEVRRRLLSIIPEESLDSLRHPQQQSAPQPSDPLEPSATSISPLSAHSHQTDTQNMSPAGHAPSSSIALQRVSPDYGPITGGEKIFLAGYGFSEGQDLLVRFGDGTEPVSTKLFNPNILECILPPSHSARRVVVTLHWEDGPEIQNEGDVLFTYEDVDNELTSSSHRVLNLWRQKSSRLKYNPSQYSFTASSMCGPPVSTESRNILTTEIMGASIQDSDLSSDSDPGDDFGAPSPIPWSPEDRDSVNLVNNRGQNLAHICAQLGHHGLLINIIEKGVHIHAEDVNGRTPLDFARLYRDEDSIDILEGDWDDNIQNFISTGLLPVGLLHRYIPECVLAIQTLKISGGIRKGSRDFAQVRPMSAPVQGALRPDKFPSYNPSGPRMGPLEELEEHDESDESDISTINDVESLKHGIIRTSKNAVQAPYTILLVGETGVGKSELSKFIANVVVGRDIAHYDFKLLNEEDGFYYQGRTISSRLYELTSNNGLVVRILDTPGPADTWCIEYNELYKKSIITGIQKHIDSVTAVLILANGTIPRITVGTDHALSTLTAVFPKYFAGNIAFMFTDVFSRLSLNFSKDNIPHMLRDVSQFIFDNPFTKQRRHLSLKHTPAMRARRAEMRKEMEASEEQALEVVVNLFDWLDGLNPLSTSEIISLNTLGQTIEAMITNTLAHMDQVAAKKVKIDKLMVTLKDSAYDINMDSHFENVTRAFWKLQDSYTNNMICGKTDCYSNCDIDIDCKSGITEDRFQGTCHKCGHRLWIHNHCRAKWAQVTDTQVHIDQYLRKKWVAAKDEKEKKAVLAASRDNALRHFNQITNSATNDLAQLLQRYARLSLAGGFSAQMESAVRLLGQIRVDQHQLENVAGHLDHMKRKLGLLNYAMTPRKKGAKIGSQKYFG